MANDTKTTNLPLVKIQVSGPKVVKRTVALLDTGSDTTFMCTTLANTVGLTGPHKTITLAGINSENKEKVIEVANVSISTAGSRRQQSYRLQRVLVRKAGAFPNFNN